MVKLDGFEERIKKLEEHSHKQATLSDMEENARKAFDEYKRLNPRTITYPWQGPLGGIGTRTLDAVTIC